MYNDQVEQIKTSVDIIALAEQYTILHKWGRRGEFAGACPKGCGAEQDGFHVHAEGWFKCYTCHIKRGDVIELVQWLHDCDFKTALNFLTGDKAKIAALKPLVSMNKRTKPKRSVWQDAGWQQQAQRQVQQARANLTLVQGYLTRRGITVETARAWGVGGMVNRAGRKFVVFAWQGQGIVKALNYRSADDDERRFFQRAGSTRTLYGIDLLGTHEQTLIITEGELNALSLWQVTRGRDVDVISVGAEGNTTNDYALKLAARYKTVIVWTDKAQYAREFMRRYARAQGLQSPDGLDANDLLQRGLLQEFINLVLARMTGKEIHRAWRFLNDLELEAQLETYAVRFAEYRDNSEISPEFIADYECGLLEWERRHDG